MKSTGLSVIGGVLVTILLAAAQAERNQEAVLLLKAAINTELVDGHLRAAVDQYRHIVDLYGKTDRATAAEALVHMAECYKKLGEAEATKVYERIIRDYADQQQAATVARARLRGPGSAGPVLVWPRAKVDGYGNARVSPDGRRIAYVDWSTGDLALRDLSTSTDRRLTHDGDMTTPPGTYAGPSAFSPDGERIAFGWFSRVKGRYVVRLASLGGEPSQTRVIYDHDDTDWVQPHDWSGDGRWLALQIKRRDRTGQIALLNVGNGAVQVLKSFPWQAASRAMRFSPDGKYLAFDQGQSRDGIPADVFVLAVDGSREAQAVMHPADDEMLAWTKDGNRLLFWSDRSGPWSLWVLDMQDGRPKGIPRLVRSGFGEPGRFAPLGLTANDSLLYAQSRSLGSGIQIAEMDFASGRLAMAPYDAGLELSSLNQIFTYAWSRNGQSLAVFRRARPGASLMELSVKDMTTGSIREMRPQSGDCATSLQWAAGGSFFICQGRHVVDREGVQTSKAGVLKIEAATGVASYVASGRTPALSDDDRTVYFLRTNESAPDQGRVAVIERQLNSGSERTLLTQPALSGLRLSPDGRFLATVSTDPTTPSGVLLLVPVAAGDAREILKVSQGTLEANTLFWSPDSGSVFIRKTVPAGKPVFVRVTREGEVTLLPELDLGGNVQVHADGRHLAFSIARQDSVDVHRIDGIITAR